MNINDMVAAMAAKTVDAMVDVEPYNAIAEADGIANVAQATSRASTSCRCSWRRRRISSRRTRTPSSHISRPGSKSAREFKEQARQGRRGDLHVLHLEGLQDEPDTFRRRWRASRSIPGFPSDLKPYMHAPRRNPAQGKEDQGDPGLEEGAAPGIHGEGARLWRSASRLRPISQAAHRLAPEPFRRRRLYACTDIDDGAMQSGTPCVQPRRYEPVDLEFQAARAPRAATASAAWAKAWRSDRARTAAASCGSRTRARRRTSPPSTCPIRASRRWSCRPTCRSPTCARTRSRSIGDIMAVAYQMPEGRAEAGGLRAVRHLRAGKAEVDRLLRLLRPALARRAPALVLRRRVRPPGVRRARLPADPSAGRPVLPLHRRAQPVEADRGRPLVAARHPQGRRRRRRPRATRRRRSTGLPRPQHQRLSAAAATGSISAISTAACSSSTSPTRRSRS